MIKSSRRGGFRQFWETGSSRRIDAGLADRIHRRLSALDQAERPEEMNLPGFDFRKLRGKPARYTVHVNGPWCITFEWSGVDAVRVDLEQYH